ncbi:MAG: uroporphyrinogen decarboxylase [Planctomycetota bacterium]
MLPSRPTSRARFLAAARRQPLPGGPPAWVMRQAGRYLPEYRARREGRTFLEMVRDPAVAAELTCQPVRRFDMDAAVIFSDILVPPAAMGAELSFVPGEGPVFAAPVRDAAGVEALRDFDPRRETAFLGEAIRRVRDELGDEKAIVGFCGAPFTVASYLIEGGASEAFEHSKAMLHGDPDLFQRLVERIVDNQIGYLEMQVEAGADVLQIFDSWGGALAADTWRRALLPAMCRLVAGAKATGVPVILYANGASHLLEALADAGPDVVGLDWRVDPAGAIRRIGDRVALQGNLDPSVLFAPPGVVAAETARTIDAFALQRGYIFNLGSGILPRTPLESMEAVFATIRARREDGR